MARVTDTEVIELYGPTDRDVHGFIDAATLIVDEQLASGGLSEARLRMIELYLAAHFLALAIEKGSIVREDTGNARQSMWGVSLGTGLTMTRYGQQAIIFDTSGALAEISTSSRKARFTVV